MRACRRPDRRGARGHDRERRAFRFRGGRSGARGRNLPVSSYRRDHRAPGRPQHSLEGDAARDLRHRGLRPHTVAEPRTNRRLRLSADGLPCPRRRADASWSLPRGELLGRERHPAHSQQPGCLGHCGAALRHDLQNPTLGRSDLARRFDRLPFYLRPVHCRQVCHRLLHWQELPRLGLRRCRLDRHHPALDLLRLANSALWRRVHQGLRRKPGQPEDACPTAVSARPGAPCNLTSYALLSISRPLLDERVHTMKTILIAYHSLTGGTCQMADAAARGAEAQTAVQVHLLQAREAGPNDVLNADGYIFATPENLAAMGGIMKDFFDRTYYPVLDRINGRPYAVLICAGSDGQNAARQIERIATGWRLRAIADPIIVCTHAQTPEAIFAPKLINQDDLARCEDLGVALIKRHLRDADRADRLRDGPALSREHLNLPQLRNDLLRLVPLLRHSSVLHMAQSHTSGRTTSQGADQRERGRDARPLHRGCSGRRGRSRSTRAGVPLSAVIPNHQGETR